MQAPATALPDFRAPFAPPDDELAARFLADAPRTKRQCIVNGHLAKFSHAQVATVLI